MEYIAMTIEDAKKVTKPNAIVLVSKQDLKIEDCNIDFKRKKFIECFPFINKADKIDSLDDDEFMNALRVFSEKHSTMHTILYRKE